jgi:dihydrofolate synthase/folylpolyglutamate synthase
MPHPTRDYGAFLARLTVYERIEPFPRSRRPDKLAGVRWLMERLGHPESALRVAHVAGTNGKGMTCAMLAGLLQAAGYRTGLYTSPHVMDLRERIVIAGEPISEVALAVAGHQVLDAADSGRTDIYFSYFDVLTAMAVLAFREAGCAWAVLETGLGGLSDATNSFDKAIAVLTRIGYDHMYVLGNTLREIAEQKLGIVRAGIPTVLGAQDPALEEWMAERIRALGSVPLPAATYGIELPSRPGETVRASWPDGTAVTVAVPGVSLTRIKAICAANALCAADALLGPARGAERATRVRTVLATELPGRLERRSEQRIRGSAFVLRRLVLDGGHNAGALDALADQLGWWGVTGYTLIIGLQADKLVAEARAPLARLLGAARRILTLAPQTARAPAPDVLAAFLRSALPPGSGTPIETLPDARSALLAAARMPDDTVVAAGSFWMLGDLMRLLEPAAARP